MPYKLLRLNAFGAFTGIQAKNAKFFCVFSLFSRRCALRRTAELFFLAIHEYCSDGSHSNGQLDFQIILAHTVAPMLNSMAMGAGGRTLVVLLLMGTTVSASAAKSMTVAEFNQWIAAKHGQSDAKIARHISSMELSERAGEADLAKWEAALPGPHTRDALVALVDASGFLASPPAEISKKPAPEMSAQQAMLSLAVEYLRNILPKLPDFSATRETTHFEDRTPIQIFAGSSAPETFSTRRMSVSGSDPVARTLPGEPMHFVAQTSMTVTYRNGLEVQTPQDSNAVKRQAAEGFTTSGEFGPILSVIVGDAIHSDVRWGYWEEDSATSEAVFRYTVSQQNSHFTVQLPTAQQEVSISPAYHGEIAVDPATGSILRMSLISDLSSPYKGMQVDILVEYAPVVIGNRTYICPVKGVALSKIPVIGGVTDANHPAPSMTKLNDITFTNYHLFRADAKILP